MRAIRLRTFLVSLSILAALCSAARADETPPAATGAMPQAAAAPATSSQPHTTQLGRIEVTG